MAQRAYLQGSRTRKVKQIKNILKNTDRNVVALDL